MKPKIAPELVQSILTVADENPTWDCHDVARAVGVEAAQAEAVMRYHRYNASERPQSDDRIAVDAYTATLAFKSPEAPKMVWKHRPDLSEVLAAAPIDDAQAKAARARQEGGDHYKRMGVEPWDVIDTWPFNQRIGFFRGNALKYLMRMGSKDERLTEVRKARHYIDKLIEVLEEEQRDAT